MTFKRKTAFVFFIGLGVALISTTISGGLTVLRYNAQGGRAFNAKLIQLIRYGITSNPLLSLAIFSSIFALIYLARLKLNSMDYLVGDGRNILLDGKRGNHSEGIINEKLLNERFYVGKPGETPGIILGYLPGTKKVISFAEEDEVDLPKNQVKDSLHLIRNILVMAEPGRGKSDGYGLPFTYQMTQAKHSMIIVDPKGDVCRLAHNPVTKAYGEDNVFILHIKKPEVSDGIDLMSLFDMGITDRVTMASRMAEAIQSVTEYMFGSKGVWNQFAKEILQAIILRVETGIPVLGTTGGRSLTTVAEIAEMPLDRMMAVLLESGYDSREGQIAARILKEETEVMRLSELKNLRSMLSGFQSPAIRDIFSHNDISFKKLATEPCAVFIICDNAGDDALWATSLILNTLHTALIKGIADNPANGAPTRLPVPLEIIIDEFPNIGKIFNIRQLIKTCRSSGIRYFVIAQDIPDIESAYGQPETDAIISGFDIQIAAGAINDLRTTGEHFSRLSTTMHPVYTDDDGKRHVEKGRPVYLPEELKMLGSRGEGEIKADNIVFMAKNRPIPIDFFPAKDNPMHDPKNTYEPNEHIPKWKRK